MKHLIIYVCLIFITSCSMKDIDYALDGKSIKYEENWREIREYAKLSNKILRRSNDENNEFKKYNNIVVNAYKHVVDEKYCYLPSGKRVESFKLCKAYFDYYKKITNNTISFQTKKLKYNHDYRSSNRTIEMCFDSFIKDANYADRNDIEECSYLESDLSSLVALNDIYADELNKFFDFSLPEIDSKSYKIALENYRRIKPKYAKEIAAFNRAKSKVAKICTKLATEANKYNDMALKIKREFASNPSILFSKEHKSYVENQVKKMKRYQQKVLSVDAEFNRHDCPKYGF